jgi:hypothetical protein
VRNIARTGVIAVLSVGVLDAFDVVDIGVEGPDGGLDHEVLAAHDAAEIAGVEEPGIHFVEPHEVSGYVRDDGTAVGPLWRDGDGDTSSDLTIEDGGGYWRTNPDGDPTNNLKA